MASFLSEPGQKCLVEDEENLDPRSAERAMVMESQAFWQEHDQPNQKGHATNNGEGRSSWAFAPQFLLTGSAQVPPGGLAGLAGTFSAPVGTGQLAGSLQAPVSGALHGSLRVPLSSPHILLSSPGPAVREINPAADAEEDMRQRIQSSVRRIVTSAQVNATTHPESVNKTLRFASAAAPPTMSTHHPQDARSMSTDIAPGGGQHMAKQIPQGFVRGRQLSPVRMYANRDGSPVLVYRTGMMKPRVSLPGQQPSTSLPL